MDDHRNYFCICAGGAEFDVDAFAKATRLKFARFERKDFQHKSIEIELGCGADLEFEEQQAIAVEFLSTNKDAMSLLRSDPAVTVFYLGLEGSVLRDSLGSIFDLSPSLMKMALETGIQVTVWACLR